MTWEQKLAALQGVSGGAPGIALHMKAPGEWYVVCRAMVGRQGHTRSEPLLGKTPEEAVCEAWNFFTNVGDEYVMPNISKPIGCRWNGFMWEQFDLSA